MTTDTDYGQGTGTPWCNECKAEHAFAPSTCPRYWAAMNREKFAWSNRRVTP